MAMAAGLAIAVATAGCAVSGGPGTHAASGGRATSVPPRVSPTAPASTSTVPPGPPGGGTTAVPPGGSPAAEVREAVTECRALRSTLRSPPSQWDDGIFAIAAEGTPPALARAITAMEIAVGDSYGPQLAPGTAASIAAVASICARPPIDVTGIRFETRVLIRSVAS
jgi:hypothetical protein